jgi:hypothetical protein
MPIRRRGRTVPQAVKVIVSIMALALATGIAAALFFKRIYSASYEHPIGMT